MNDVYQPSTDPIWHRWVDGLIILFIGLAAGVVLAGTLMMGEVTTTTTTTRTTEILRRNPSAPQVESGMRSDVPYNVQIDEI